MMVAVKFVKTIAAVLILDASNSKKKIVMQTLNAQLNANGVIGATGVVVLPTVPMVSSIKINSL